MLEFDERIVQLAAILLIPMAPAFVLYRFLPSKTSVAGPFKGLNIRLTGSFSGYFLLVLMAFSYFNIVQKEDDTQIYEEWKIEGAITLPGKRQNEIEEKLIQLKLHPPTTIPPEPPTGNTVRFTVRLPIKRSPDGSIDTQYFERIYFSYPGYKWKRADIPASSLRGGEFRYYVGTYELEKLNRDSNDTDGSVAEPEATHEVVDTEWQQ